MSRGILCVCLSILLVLVAGVVYGGSVALRASKAQCTKYTSQTLVGAMSNYNGVTPKPKKCPFGCELYLLSTSALVLLMFPHSAKFLVWREFLSMRHLWHHLIVVLSQLLVVLKFFVLILANIE